MSTDRPPHGPPRPPGRGLPKRKLAAIFALFVVLITGMIGYNVESTAAMGRTALLVNVSGRQSNLARRYADEVFLKSEGFVADPGPDRAKLEKSAGALLHGGAADSPLSGSNGEVRLPRPHDWKLVRKLTQEIALTADMTKQGDRLLAEGRDAPSYGTDLFAVRLSEAKLETVAADATYQMTIDVRSAGDHLQRVEIILGLLSTLAAFGMAWLLMRSATRQSARFRSLVDNAWGIILVAGATFRVEYVSPSSERVLGYAPQRLQGSLLTDLLHPDDIDAVAGLLGGLPSGTGETVAFETRMRRRDGAWRTMAWTATNLLEDPAVGGYVLNGGDVTEVRQATEDLAAARDGALTASKAKSNFLATMSHEIRTPMNGVIGLTELLLGTALDGDQRELASGVKVSAENLLVIINDILDFSKIEAGKIDLEEAVLSVPGVADDVGRILADAAHRKGLELLVDVHPEVPAALVGDVVRVQQVLLNLGSNAVKFTAEGEVVIRVTVTDENAGRVALRFEVIDTGIGVAVGDQERLFRAFSQADSSTTRKFGGTGLGLAICRQLVELMGGELGLTSAPGEGSTFWFELSLPRPDDEQSTETGGDPANLAGRRALVVDDNATNRMILRQQLLSWGIEAVEAVDGLQAVSAAAAAAEEGHGFDLGVLDLNMPDMDGIELARVLKADPTTATMTLFLLSSSGERLGAAESHLRGFAGSLTKPVRQSELFDCLITGLNGGIPVIPASHPSTTAPLEGVARMGLILLVEDNKMNQFVESKVLEKLGYRFDIANHGGEAVSAVQARSYAAILMDCQMPEMDGYEATAAIRRIEGSARHTPIIAMTAAAMAGDRDICLAAGMDDYITKPVGLEAIAAVLQRWVSPPAPDAGAGREIDESPGDGPAQALDPSQIELLRSLDDGDGAVLGEIIDQYLAQTVEGRVELGRVVGEGDADALKRTAHALGGASANIGARALAAVCAEMETQGRVAQLDGAAGLVARFDTEFTRVREALNLVASET